DRKSTRLNSSHVSISYAVFCLKKKRLDIRATHRPHRLVRVAGRAGTGRRRQDRGARDSGTVHNRQAHQPPDTRPLAAGYGPAAPVDRSQSPTNLALTRSPSAPLRTELRPRVPLAAAQRRIPASSTFTPPRALPRSPSRQHAFP